MLLSETTYLCGCRIFDIAQILPTATRVSIEDSSAHEEAPINIHAVQTNKLQIAIRY